MTALLLAGQNAIERDGKLYFREYAPCRVSPDIYRSISSFNYTVRDGGNADEKLVTFDQLTFVFSKTAEGWKVTGGDFIDRLDAIFETGRATPPSTGDAPAAMIIPALIILAALYCVVIKRSCF